MDILRTYTQTIEGREWKVDVLASTERPDSEWGTPNSATTYRDYEQAATVVTYHDGAPVVPEAAAVAMHLYPAAWDIPTGENFNQTYMDWEGCQPIDSRWAERSETVAEMVRKAHEPIEPTVVCPECGGSLLDSEDYSKCEGCEWYEDTSGYHRDPFTDEEIDRLYDEHLEREKRKRAQAFLAASEVWALKQLG